MKATIPCSGMSETYFRKSGYAIDQYVYHDECLEPYLLKLIEKYQKIHKFVFWPDLASAHFRYKIGSITRKLYFYQKT